MTIIIKFAITITFYCVFIVSILYHHHHHQIGLVLLLFFPYSFVVVVVVVLLVRVRIFLLSCSVVRTLNGLTTAFLQLDAAIMTVLL